MLADASSRSTTSRTAPLPPPSLADDLAMLSNRRTRVRRTGAETNHAERGKIVHIVSNKADFLSD